MPEIFSPQNQLARPLFRELERSHALVPALFEGNLTARLYVDDASAPRAGVIVCNGRVLCAGDAPQADFLAEMARRFSDELLPAHRARGDDAVLVCASGAGWDAVFSTLFAGGRRYTETRQYYEITDFSPRPDLRLPDGFSMHLITPEFLSRKLGGLSLVREEMCSERSSVEEFLEWSFGLCPVHSDAIAGWCMSEYNVAARCEIGIATAEEHQRKGIASLSTWYFLAEAHRRGYQRVGWDCWARNLASAAAARKAGLSLVEEYPAHVIEFS